jgi:hypothetical protein
MIPTKYKIIRYMLFSLSVIICIYCFITILYPRISLIGKKTPYKVYIALGFHTNLYHSYRIDTNDEAGFGSDIRIIRHIINVLNDYNRKGVPVKGVWDIENLFSLEEVLPKYAPDIINNIKKRIDTHGDEIILMSYNNGLTAAFNQKEFEDVIKRTISNNKKSGIKDIFKKYSPIVRPQEMVASPGNYRLYKKHGIEAVSLYYSAVTFDSIRAFIRPLSLTEAFNPLLYENGATGDRIRIIPTYNHGDLVENISLRSWVTNLHRGQLKGTIDRDVLLFLNFDADDSYWTGYKLPKHLAWLPNTGGLKQLIEEVKDLDFVKFTTLNEYLKNHADAGKISFGQDIADGNFNGFNSWAEKFSSHLNWKVVMDSRVAEKIIKAADKYLKEPIAPKNTMRLRKAYEERLRLLSTTNFGMSAPYLARAREQVVENITGKIQSQIKPMLEMTRNALEAEAGNVKYSALSPGLRFVDTIFILNIEDDILPAPGLEFSFNMQDKNIITKDTCFYLIEKNGKCHAAPIIFKKFEVDSVNITIKLKDRAKLENGIYSLYLGHSINSPQKIKSYAGVNQLKNRFLCLNFDPQGIMQSLTCGGRTVLEEKSLAPRVHFKSDYVDKILIPKKASIHVLNAGSAGVASLLWKGEIPAPGKETGKDNAEDGKFCYRLSLCDDLPYLFVHGTIQYPQTARNDILSPDQAQLIRRLDRRWHETAPFELALTNRADTETPFKVIKDNFLGVESNYLIDYFKHIDENFDLPCINNHITPAYAAVAGKDGGVVVAMNNNIFSNFAFCPLKMDYHALSREFSVKMNPFGTYYGRQYYQPTWSNRQGYHTAIMTGQQYYSSAPTYNGAYYTFALALGFFEGRELPKQIKTDMNKYANPPLIVSGGNIKILPAVDLLSQEPAPPPGVVAAYENGRLYIHWEKAPANPLAYTVHLTDRQKLYPRAFQTKSTTFITDKIKKNKTYFVKISSIYQSGKQSRSSDWIKVNAVEYSGKKPGTALPLWLELKIVWSSIIASLKY